MWDPQSITQPKSFGLLFSGWVGAVWIGLSGSLGWWTLLFSPFFADFILLKKLSWNWKACSSADSVLDSSKSSTFFRESKVKFSQFPFSFTFKHLSDQNFTFLIWIFTSIFISISNCFRFSKMTQDVEMKEQAAPSNSLPSSSPSTLHRKFNQSAIYTCLLLLSFWRLVMEIELFLMLFELDTYGFFSDLNKFFWVSVRFEGNCVSDRDRCIWPWSSPYFAGYKTYYGFKTEAEGICTFCIPQFRSYPRIRVPYSSFFLSS